MDVDSVVEVVDHQVENQEQETEPEVMDDGLTPEQAEAERQYQQELRLQKIPNLHRPLTANWVIWTSIVDKDKSYEDSLIRCADFDTLHGFYSSFRACDAPCELQFGQDYSVFKDGIIQSFENEANVNGGRWSLYVQKSLRQTHLDKLWLRTVLFMVGTLTTANENVDHNVCGAMVSVRSKGDRISIWTSNCEDKASILEIGKGFKAALGLSDDQNIGYFVNSKVRIIKSRMNDGATYFV